VHENPVEHMACSRGSSQVLKKYLVIVERTEAGYSAFSPDVPGCASTGKTKEEVKRNIQEAIAFHLEGLREEGYEIPEPSIRLK
jgi:predicted RNase H-like HicB family nuclease